MELCEKGEWEDWNFANVRRESREVWSSVSKGGCIYSYRCLSPCMQLWWGFRDCAP